MGPQVKPKSLAGRAMHKSQLEAALAEYVSTLIKSTGTTSRAQDRATYQSHLASAAVMFLAIYQDDMIRLKEIVDAEVRSFG